MRASQWFMPTLKEIPNDAEIISHQLMLRAGMIRKLGSGLYTWLPLGLKVLRKVEKIVREEMDRSGALEFLMPAIQPAELWQETGRWETFGGQLLTMKDSNERDYCFGPTHEEVITDLMRKELQSYKQLPMNCYQIQTKFRDEIRPRFGVMRAREFLMKDAYSFHLSPECLDKTYKVMYTAYCQVFDKLGLKYRAVDADTGAIGGSASNEFQVLADSGEDLIFYSDQSSYAANIERATCLLPQKKAISIDTPMRLIDTPNLKTIDQVSAFLGVEPNATVKTLIVAGKEHPYVALVLRGGDDVNEVKAIKHPLIHAPFKMIDDGIIAKELKLPVGFLGPVELNIPIIVDHHASVMSSFTCGANQKDKHFTDVVWERDAHYQHVFDLRNVQVGDLSPDGQGHLQSCRGIEVGHIFKLGDKYAEAMHAEVVNEQGQLQTMTMGCYGLGISRVVAAAIEQNHDDRGIIWPESMAPFQWVIIPLNAHKTPEVQAFAEKIYQLLSSKCKEVLLDDRDERPGVLFADQDLIGIPHRMIIGQRGLSQGLVEYKSRKDGEVVSIPVDEIEQFISKV